MSLQIHRTDLSLICSVIINHRAVKQSGKCHLRRFLQPSYGHMKARSSLALRWNQGYFAGSPGNSAGKESACNVGDPSSIPGSEGSPGEGIGHPLQYSWASLVAQMVKNPPELQETWFDPWVGKIPWRRATGSSILAWRIPWTEEPGGLQSMGSQRVRQD